MKKDIKTTGNMPAIIGFSLSKFNELKTKDRFFHANGSGYYGDFTSTNDLSEYTTAQFLTGNNKKFKIAIRFSNTVADHGTSELLRDNRGFSVRFFGDNELLDIVGLSTPIQWVDKAESTNVFHQAFNRDERTNTINFNNKWAFVESNPSGLHVLTMIYSDTGIPRGWENMNGYGCQTYSLVNKNGKRVWVKFHFKTQQGRAFYTDEEATLIAFNEPDKMSRNMHDLISGKNFPKWKVYIQIAEENSWENVEYNMFSTTNIWPHKDFPLIEVGEIELNELAENQIKEFDQIGFGPGNLPVGIGLSPDFALLSRAKAYPMVQELRLGKKLNPLPDHVKKDFELYKASQVYIDSQNKQEEEHYYLQPRNLWKMFNDDQKNRLYKNIAVSLSQANQEIIDGVIVHFDRIHPDYADGVSKAIKNLAE